MYGGTNEAVRQGDLKGQGGAGGKSGMADGYKFGDCDAGCAQGHPKGAQINTGQNDAKGVHSANEKGAILSKLCRAGGVPSCKPN